MSALSIKNKLTIAFVLAILVMTTAQTYITGSQIFAETTRSINQYALAWSGSIKASEVERTTLIFAFIH